MIPDSVKKANTPLPSYGPITQVGDGCKQSWQEGDLVMFSKFAGTDFTVQNEDFRLVHEDEVLAILDCDEQTFGAVPVKED